MLDLTDLRRGLPAISPAWGNALVEVAGVCLESQGHSPGVRLAIKGLINNSFSLFWPVVTDQAIRAWADLQEATEYGATAIAVLLAKRELGFEVIERSAKGTGIDYWLGHEVDGPPFQRKARLEISGILKADGSDGEVARTISARVREKLNQTQPSSGSLTAYVIVLEFGRPLAEAQKT